jgi:glycosyltransferase involved in cell wall biosynthesis
MTSPSPKPTVSFVVPALNEEGNIENTVQSIMDSVNVLLADFEIVLVNDGSTDNTGEVMKRLAATNKHLRVVQNEQNLGFGGAYKRGVVAATMDHVIMICADNVLPPSSIRLILERIGEADIVITYISNPEFRSMGRRIGSWGFTTVINTLFGLHVSYYNGSVVHKRALLRQITIHTNSFAYQAEALVKLLKAGCSYVEVGIPNVSRQKGKSSALRPKNLAQVFKTIINLFREVRRPGAIPILTKLSVVASPKGNS